MQVSVHVSKADEDDEPSVEIRIVDKEGAIQVLLLTPEGARYMGDLLGQGATFVEKWRARKGAIDVN